MKILIVGAGGVGGYFGAHLARAGLDITYLLRAKRKAMIDTHGLRVESPQGAFTVQPKTIVAEDVQPHYDLILIAVKSYDLDEVMRPLQDVLGQGVVLPFLNGLDHLDKLDRLLGKERVMAGVAHIAATITPEGAVRQLTDLHRLTVGARHPRHQELASAFIKLCEGAPFESLLTENIEQMLWDKWAFLAALAGMTTLCRGSVGDIVETPYGRGATIQMYEECCRVARASGYAISAEASVRALEILTAKGSSFTASMLRDLLNGQPTEHDHILGAMIRRGQSLDCPTPLLAVAHTNMSIQSGRDKSSH